VAAPPPSHTTTRHRLLVIGCSGRDKDDGDLKLIFSNPVLLLILPIPQEPETTKATLFLYLPCCNQNDLKLFFLYISCCFTNSISNVLFINLKMHLGLIPIDPSIPLFNF
jgi:hypothetical protein